MPYADGDVRIHYQVEGEGPALVLQHGFTERVVDWYEAGYVEALRPDYRLILIDARGHGASDKPHDPDAYVPADYDTRRKRHSRRATVAGFGHSNLVRRTLQLGRRAVYRLVRRYTAALGFEIGAHALWATAATNALDNQAHIAKVQEWLGQPSASTITARHGPRTARLSRFRIKRNLLQPPPRQRCCCLFNRRRTFPPPRPR